MKINKELLKERIVYVICLLYIILFIYAAVNKLLDFENFQVQLGQSPMVSSFASWIAVLVPATEILIAALLSFKQYRRIGLIMSYILMCAFTAYIYIILNFSTYVPCSCGGVLEALSWKQHLLFNAIFVLMAGIALVISKPVDNFRAMGISVAILIVTGVCVLAVIFATFRFSEISKMEGSTFLRRFIPHPADPVDTIDLRYPTYYFGGSGDGKIYLGNQRSPLQVTEIDTLRMIQKTHQLKISYIDSFRSLQLRVDPPGFILTDGTQPLILHGNTAQWQAYPVSRHGRTFSQPVAVGPSVLVTRSQKPYTGENSISIQNIYDSTEYRSNDRILEKQIDGLYDTDGKLHYDQLTDMLLYCYRYRNDYMTFDTQLRSIDKAKTIDTISKAQLSVVHLKSRNEIKLNKPPLIVNRTSAFHGGLLFVSSALPGKYERKEIWKAASIIDVYDTRIGKYLYSFYLYDMQGKKAKQMMIYGNSLYYLGGTSLVRCRLQPAITSNFKGKKK